ncbi:MAG: aldo/keto reductase [Alphaproteobacteria bacterium]|nr:aldo/keto reductase [Alphaproteobacteria bacterium]
MKTRRFGRTGLQISELVFGGGWVGGLLIHQDDEVKRAAIRRAIDGGINWIDTAGDYGQGQSEIALGWLLEELETAERPHVSTKVRLDLTSDESHESQIRRGIETSLHRLRLNKVSLFQLHNPVQPKATDQHVSVDDVIADGGIADLLDGLRREGLTDQIGFTALGDTASCIRVVESGKMDSAQVYYNMLNPTAAMDETIEGLQAQDFCGLMAACRRHDVGIMNIRVFAAGVLATDRRHGREVAITPESADLKAEAQRARAAMEAAGDSGESRAETAIRFSLANADLSCVVVGLAELEHLELALQAAESGPLPAARLSALRDVWSRNFDL